VAVCGCVEEARYLCRRAPIANCTLIRVILGLRNAKMSVFLSRYRGFYLFTVGSRVRIENCLGEVVAVCGCVEDARYLCRRALKMSLN
jgi:hypothetical protein